MTALKKLGILLSGRGSNFEAIADSIQTGKLQAEIAIVISNRGEAKGLQSARQRGLRTQLIVSKGRIREEHDAEVIAALKEANVDLVCLAGYMRLLSGGFVGHFAGRMLNIHPSLLPAFPGLHPHRQALAHGVRVSGATVHFVDDGVDTGPIVLQAAVPVRPEDTEESLAARVLAEEHRLYPEAVRLFAEGRLQIRGRRVDIGGVTRGV